MVDQWNSVVWYDASRFSNISADRDSRVIRKPGERYRLEHNIPNVKLDGSGIMVWGCFWAGGCYGTVGQDEYINILTRKFHPWYRSLTNREERDFIFQEDGATCHTDAHAQWWKETHQIRGFDYWPAQTPDLNHIKHIWWALQCRLYERRVEKHSRRTCQMFIRKYEDRCQAVIDALGGPTKY